MEGSSCSDQATEIANRFKDIDIYIVGESYSGRVAYELFKILGGRVKGIVFSAGFISSHSILSKLAGVFPVSFIRPNIFTKKLLYLVGFGLIGGSKSSESVFSSVGKANKDKLKSRLRNIASLDEPGGPITCPETYIRPSKDFLVTTSSVNLLSEKCLSFMHVTVDGGHFIAQSNPVECARTICNAENIKQKNNWIPVSWDKLARRITLSFARLFERFNDGSLGSHPA